MENNINTININTSGSTLSAPSSCSIHIVDSMMGTGKTNAAINYINESPADSKFIVITPFLTEVERYKTRCSGKRFKEPLQKMGKKLNDIKDLIREGANVVCTHALFQRFDDEVVEICRSLGYTMIMDEVANVVEPLDITEKDLNTLMSQYCYAGDDGLVVWREDAQDYTGRFEDIKNLCNLGGLVIARNRMLIWLLPTKAFEAFKEIYILTYMFDAQLQRYYYDYYNIAYDYMHVEGTNMYNSRFVSGKSSEDPGTSSAIDYSALVNIVQSDKMNMIGDTYYALSSSWFQKNSGNALMKQLKNNTINFFRNIRTDNSRDNIWTAFKEYKSEIAGKGYTKGFLSLSQRATNTYKDRSSVAYLANIFLNPMVKGFFVDHGVKVDEDAYALSEMLQFIWRSAIRDERKIWVYVPSRRMRELLMDWIAKISNII